MLTKEVLIASARQTEEAAATVAIKEASAKQLLLAVAFTDFEDLHASIVYLTSLQVLPTASLAGYSV